MSEMEMEFMTQMWTEIQEQPTVLQNCMRVNRETIEEIVDRIKEKHIDTVIIAARGTSDHAAVYAKYIIEIRLGIPVVLAAPSVFTIYGKTLKMKNSLVVAISQSGCAADALEVLKSAKEQDALTVAVTNNVDSPLAREAGFHLFCATGTEISVAATKTFTSEMYLMAQLTACWSGDEDFKERLSDVPRLVSETLERSGLIQQKVERYRFMNDCFVLARGVNYPIALESALKIQETTYVRARAYASSDFYHGPLAMVDEDTPVIIYAPKGESLGDTKGIIHKLKDAGADLLIVSNDPETLALGDCTIDIPDVDNDTITPFMNAVTAQMFALHLALLKGRNPDSPRGLKKITVTR